MNYSSKGIDKVIYTIEELKRTMSQMRIAIFLLFIFSVPCVAVNFNQYCSFSKGEQDCSAEFVAAIKAVSVSGDSLVFEASEVYWLDIVDTSDLTLSNVKLVGIGHEISKPKILSDRFHLVNIEALTINNIEVSGIHSEEGDTQQSEALVLLGSKSKSIKVKNIAVQNTTFSNAAETLLAVWNAEKVTISNNIMKRSGLAMRVAYTESDPDDLRPRGNGIVFSGIDDAIVNFNEFYEIKKMGLFLAGINRDIYVLNNHFDLLSFEKPTKRYGLKGGAGIYIGNAPTFYNVLIQENRFLNYRMNAIRMNGENIIVKKNYFNFKGDCKEMDNSISEPDTGIAIKAHYLLDSEITDNCFQNSYTAVALDSWGDINNVLVKGNITFGLTNGIFASTKYGGVYSNIKITHNVFYDALKYGITFFSDNVSHGNAIISNTFVNNDGSQQAALISLRHQANFYFAHNWMLAEAVSQNWNFLTLLNVNDSVFKGSIFKSYSGKDRSFGGITVVDVDSQNNSFFDLTFEKLNPGIIDNGQDNTFDNITYVD